MSEFIQHLRYVMNKTQSQKTLCILLDCIDTGQLLYLRILILCDYQEIRGHRALFVMFKSG